MRVPICKRFVARLGVLRLRALQPAVACLAIGVSAIPACAADALLAKVWTGAIGRSEIVACFDGDGSVMNTGAGYYYRKHLQTIRLEATADSGTWIDESAEGATWVFERVTRDSAIGRWTSARRRKALPIRLVAVPWTGESPCGSIAYNRPLHEDELVEVRVDTLPHPRRCLRTLSAQDGSIGGSWLQLCDTGSVARTINAALPMGVESYMGGYRLNVACGEEETKFREYSETTGPTFVSDSYLVVEHGMGGYCGGPHPFIETRHLTFDLATGEAIDPWSWIEGVSFEDASFLQPIPPPKLLEAIRSRMLRDEADSSDECAKVLAENEIYHPRLDSAGMRFATRFAHAIQACDEESLVPWNELRPFLNAEGRRAVRSIPSDLEDKKRR